MRSEDWFPQRIRIVTAASLFDGHDAAINIMRRLLQARGAEVIHLGHNRSVAEIVECAIEEDAHAVAITSYQGGHLEFFRFVKDSLDGAGCGHILIFGGGGGTILPEEAEQLHAYGIARIYSPDDGVRMGLEGMVEDLLARCATVEFPRPSGYKPPYPFGERHDIRRIAREITIAELKHPPPSPATEADVHIPVIGITGTGGAGKSTVTDEVVRRLLTAADDISVAVISIDPSKRKGGGALLGDRIRMNAVHHPRVYMRSLATRSDDSALGKAAEAAIRVCKSAGYDVVLLETAGAGQGDVGIIDLCDVGLYVMTPEYGAPSQLEKINMLDHADLIVVNKSDKPGAEDALSDVRRQYRRSHGIWSTPDDGLPIVATMASKFGDPGMGRLFSLLMEALHRKTGHRLGAAPILATPENAVRHTGMIAASRSRYLGEIAEVLREKDAQCREQARLASRWYRLQGALEAVSASDALAEGLREEIGRIRAVLTREAVGLVEGWPATVARYESDRLEYNIRDHAVSAPLNSTTLSGTRIRRVCLPRYSDWGDILLWQLRENLPGHFPYTAGVFPLKRKEEDPTRMFAGEGSPERTNRRFHYLASGQPASRLSTAFDSVTLYGENPGTRPDIYGKVGNSGVSIATLDDAKKLYSGFDLCDPRTSVSMTINGPAPVILAFFLHAAIDQQCEKWLREQGRSDEIHAAFERLHPGHPRPQYRDTQTANALPDGHNGLGLALLGLSGSDVLDEEAYRRIRADTLRSVRGTVQADILKEDQAQNTCIFGIEFALSLMGDVQSWFIEHRVRNFYSVSISGYHIAEAGANPVTQLAFTLANGFTFVEYYLARGMHVDDFAPNLSFFFSNGMDPEYSVIGRVARRIWSRAMRYRYGANARSQLLKYHIQTSGRSLHAQEIAFNDIRTTLQALYAVYDNCNSLHTNAYDEAITTPTEESVRRAMAIQLILNREMGTVRNENPNQGSFLIEELTDLVEEAVLSEFDRISSRGGVPGAMERMYQRNRIQEESLHYERMKHSGALPVVGVNTFLPKDSQRAATPAREVVRSLDDEKRQQIANLDAFHVRNAAHSPAALHALREAAAGGGNVFNALMEAVPYCSLGQVTHALYETGGRYRRNM